ncbi:MAG: hypothetical protein M3N49_01770 [Candidatus Eremiobacteraeota bacterium]|nr:hypothetical protein [Candidatus Eremiobacteraeota bacterium]
MQDEIQSLNSEDVDIIALERRLEMATFFIDPGQADCGTFSPTCPDLATCGTFG